MKKRWQNFVYLILGKATLESSADGLFLSEEDMDKTVAVHDENTQLKLDAAKMKDELSAAIADKDAAVSAKKTAEDALALAVQEKDAAAATLAATLTENADLKTRITGKPAGSGSEVIDTGANAGGGKEQYSYTKKNGFSTKATV